jgi:hypothetical protein
VLSHWTSIQLEGCANENLRRATFPYAATDVTVDPDFTLGAVHTGGNGPLAGRAFCTTPTVAGTLDPGDPHPASIAAVNIAIITRI